MGEDVFEAHREILGSTANHLSKTLVSVYDLVILVPLGVEELVTGARRRDREKAREAETHTALIEEESA